MLVFICIFVYFRNHSSHLANFLGKAVNKEEIYLIYAFIAVELISKLLSVFVHGLTVIQGCGSGWGVTKMRIQHSRKKPDKI